MGPRVELDMRAALNIFFLVKFYELNYVFLGVGGCSRLLDVSWDWWRGWQPVTVRSQPVIQTTDRDTSTTAWNTHPVIQLNTTSVMGSQSAVPASHMIYPHQLRHINLPPSTAPAQHYLPPPLLYFTEAGRSGYRARTLGLGTLHFTIPATDRTNSGSSGRGIVKYCWSQS